MSFYLDQANAHLVFANACRNDPERRQHHLDLAARFERLAAIEKGLLPAELAEQEG